jgi:hypothetical protein
MDADVFDGVSCVTVGNTMLTLWQAPSRQHRVQWLARKTDELAAQHPDGIYVVQLILPSSSPPDSAARAEAVALMKRLQATLKFLVSVPLGDAIWMTLVRSIMRAALMVTGMASRHAVVATVAEGIALVVKQSAAPPSRARALDDAVGALFASLGIAPGAGGAAATGRDR